ncbi:uncharacterized protein LOC124880067 [Girardinichthys multiradiatus]|uniref:uncharacterized protein LOC124880067 n=1 Tax=Girardinichthys multiradiatus TaxID=208333 RepID=UPI001FAE744A|nr:uncharacterized protein LOC124880067 [Girardinichthys multiradiatus]
MTQPGSRRPAALRCNKNIFCVVSLLLLVYTGQSLAFEDEPLNRLVKGLTQIKEGVRLLRDDQTGTEMILLFLSMGNSTANKKQLKIFQQYLQEAVDEAYRQKVERASEFAVAMQQFNVMMLENYPKLRQLERSPYPKIKRLHEVYEQMIEVFRSYMALKKEVFTGKTKETERKLEYTLKNLCFWRKFYALVEIASVFITMLLCAGALYWVCCPIFT